MKQLYAPHLLSMLTIAYTDANAVLQDLVAPMMVATQAHHLRPLLLPLVAGHCPSGGSMPIASAAGQYFFCVNTADVMASANSVMLSDINYINCMLWHL